MRYKAFPFFVDKNSASVIGAENVKKRDIGDDAWHWHTMSAESDPLKILLHRQRMSGMTNDRLIRSVDFGDDTYTTHLYSDRKLTNMVNFCMTENEEYKSTIGLDFTFEAIKETPV